MTPLRKHLISEATKNATNHHKPYPDIAALIGLKVSPNTLYRAFEKEGYYRRAARKKPFLSKSQKKKRFEFAQSTATWDEWDWRHVF